LFTTHLFACIWYYVSTVEDPYTTWIKARGLQNESGAKLYLFSFYWSIATMVTVGFGDISAHTNCIFHSISNKIAEIIVSILWMMIGVSIYSALIGSMSGFLSVIDSKGHAITEKFIIINEFCKQAHIEPELKDRMKRSLEYRSNNYFFSLFDKNSLFDNLPYNRRYEVFFINFHSK